MKPIRQNITRVVGASDPPSANQVILSSAQENTRWLANSPQRNSHGTIWTHFVESFKKRRHMKIEGKTAKVAIPVLRILAQQAKLALEYQSSLMALSLGETEREVRLAELNLRKIEVAAQRRQYEQTADARTNKERLALQLEIATLERQIQEQRQPLPPKLSPAQQRLLKKNEIEEDLQRLRADEARALRQAVTEPEKRRVQNMYATRRDRLMEQLEKFL